MKSWGFTTGNKAQTHTLGERFRRFNHQNAQGDFTIPEPSHNTSTNEETKLSNSPACAFGFDTAGACCFFSSFSFFPTPESQD